jgi:acetyltransferase-like isoleucine patch superfamily enzyme
MIDPASSGADANRSNVAVPANVRLGEGSAIVANGATCRGVFARFTSRREPALELGAGSVADGVAFNLASDAVVRIGDNCRLEDAYLIAEQEIVIGNRVSIGWHATLVDSDLHPVAPELREQDVRALSPLGNGERMTGRSAAIHIGDDVWIGPLAVILKGVTVGRGALIEAGAVITRDVPAGARMAGNPAREQTGGEDAG